LASEPASRPATRYAALTRGQAAVVAALLLAVMGWLLAGSRSHAPTAIAWSSTSSNNANHANDESDVALYRAIVSRVHDGEGYYDAAGAELRARGYPTRPFLNWRQPTYAWFLGNLPRLWLANVLLGLLAVAVVLSARRWLVRSPWRVHVNAATVLVILTMSVCIVGNVIFLQEAWAGFFIVLSVCLFALDRWPLGVAAAFGALAFRELALLPCAVGLALALERRRWREVAAWVAGLTAYAALMSWHVVEVTRHYRPDDLARSWLSMGGASFLVETCQWNALFVALPRWAIAVLLPFVLLGLGGWRDRAGTRVALIVFGYLTAFAFLGNAFNDYWGAIYAPLLPFGIIAAPASARDLARALAGVAPSATPSRE
jgi:hypothetical protein